MSRIYSIMELNASASLVLRLPLSAKCRRTAVSPTVMTVGGWTLASALADEWDFSCFLGVGVFFEERSMGVHLL